MEKTITEEQIHKLLELLDETLDYSTDSYYEARDILIDLLY